MVGGPGAEATQGDQSEKGGAGASVVFAQRAQVAAQGERGLPDATAVRMWSWLQENGARLAAAQAQGWSPPQERPGMPTTALGVEVAEPTAIVSDASRRHAGENLQGLLDQREGDLARPLGRSDALASTEGAEEAGRIRCHGRAQGRRTCSDWAAVFPPACQGVLEGSSQGGDHDEPARKAPRSAAARLA